MVDPNEKRRIAQEVFAITGVAVPEDDPIVLAALFTAHTMQQTARDAASRITMATAPSRAIVDSAAALVEKAVANNKVLADTIELRVKKAVRDASRTQSTHEGPPQGWRGVLAGVAFGAVATAGAVGVACNFSFSWTKDAALGRVFQAVYPTLTDRSKKEWSRQVEKLHPR